MLLSLAVIFSLVVPVYAQEKDFDNRFIEQTIINIINWKKKTESKLFTSEFSKNAGSTSTDWYAIAVGRCGINDDYSSYLAMLKSNIIKRYKTEQKLDLQKATEWHRISLAMLALGGDPASIADGDSTINLIKDGCYDRGKTSSLGKQGINGYIWSLIALDSMHYAVPENASDSREDIITKILENQMENGAFALDSSTPDVDITSMALQALSSYYNDEKEYEVKAEPNDRIFKIKVRTAINRAVAWLSSVQANDGVYSKNCESTAQTIIALCALGIDPDSDSRFVKSGASVLDGLMSFCRSDGGFAHTLDNKEKTESNSFAGAQSLCALCAFYRFKNNLRGFYDFRPEQEQNLKQKISQLNKDLNTQINDKPSAEKLFKTYLEIPLQERSYVYDYYKLADALQNFNIQNTSESIADKMNQTDKNGTITDIFSSKKVQTTVFFDDEDYKAFKALPKELTSEDYAEVSRLYQKLSQAENASDYEKIREYLSNKLKNLDKIRAEIESINSEIAQNLYPFDSITQADRELVESLVQRALALSEYDQSQILGFEDLMRAKAQLDSFGRKIWITAVIVCLIALCALILVLRAKKKHIQKQQGKISQINEDW